MDTGIDLYLPIYCKTRIYRYRYFLLYSYTTTGKGVEDMGMVYASIHQSRKISCIRIYLFRIDKVRDAFDPFVHDASI